MLTPEEKANEFMAKVRPLDLLIFRGVAVFSKLVYKGSEILAGDGDASHCGIAVTRRICPRIVSDVDENEILIMECTISTASALDIETHFYTLGTQFRRLRDVLMESQLTGEDIAVCRLRNNPLDGRESFVIDTMNKIYDEYYGMHKASYTLNIFQLLGCIFPSMRGLRDASEEVISEVFKMHCGLFCSQLVAIIYIELDIIKDDDVNPQDCVPVDFIHYNPGDEVYGLVDLPPIWFQAPDSDKPGRIVEFFRKICGKRSRS